MSDSQGSICVACSASRACGKRTAEGIGPDRVRDLAAALLRRRLADCTRRTCTRHGLLLARALRVEVALTWRSAVATGGTEFVAVLWRSESRHFSRALQVSP